MSIPTTAEIGDAEIAQFNEEGFLLLEKAIPDEHLQLLRDDAKAAIEEIHQNMDEQQTDMLGPNQRGKRYFAAHRYKNTAPYVFGELMEKICRALLGDDVNLYFDQHIIKGGDKGTTFGWHQDSNKVPFQHEPFITCMAALDDFSEENGTIYLLPRSRTQDEEKLRELLEMKPLEKMSYVGDDPGVAVVVPAGSVAIYSSLTVHRSSENKTSQPRRAYHAQYSAGLLADPETGEPRFQDVPFIKDGEVVASR